jgi:hypothetical protein
LYPVSSKSSTANGFAAVPGAVPDITARWLVFSLFLPVSAAVCVAAAILLS